MRHLPTPRLRALHQQLRRTPGYSLTEVLMGLAVVGGLSAAAFVYFGRTDVAAQVKDEQDNINIMLDRASKAYGRVGSFEGMSAAQAIEQGWAPRELVQGNTLRNTWGTPVTVQPETVEGRPNAGVRVTYQDVTTDVCTKLAQAIASSMWDVQVDGQTVMGSQRGEVDPNTMVQRCNTSNLVDVAFIYHDGSQGFLATAAPLDLPCPAPQPRTESCPKGEQGYLQQQRDPVCDADNVWVGQAWGPWTTVTDNCDPNVDCVTAGTCPPPLIPGNLPCVVPPAQFRNAGCPVGQIGSTPETRTASCPAPTGVYVWGKWVPNGASTCTPAAGCPAPETRNGVCPDLQVGTRTEQRDCEGMTGTNPQWGEWYRISDTCAPAAGNPGDPCWVTGTCAPPASCNLPTAETRVVACPAPQMGVQHQERTAYCLGTGANNYEWTYWYNVATPAATCYTCPAPETATQTVPETRSVACTAGQLGSTTEGRTLTQQRTRDYTCPAAAGPAVANPWSAWSTTSSTSWAVTSSTCYTCPAPETQTRWVAHTQGPAGCEGWDVEQSRTRSYSCPPAAGPAVAGAWSPWNNTGNTSGYFNTCTPPPPACGPAPATPACAGTSSYVWNPAPAPTCWTLSGSCAPASPSCGPAPAPAPAVCPPGESGTRSWVAAPAPTCWTAVDTCAPTGSPCVAPPPMAISRALAPSSTSSACPAPQAGTQTTTCQRTESGSRDYSCPAPTGAFTSVDNWSGAITPHSCATDTSACTAAAPTVIADVNGSRFATYRSTDPAGAKLIVAFISVGDTPGFNATFANPSDWSITWDVTGVVSLSGSSNGSNGFSINHQCNNSSTDWDVTAEVVHLPTGTTTSFIWGVGCINVGL